MELDSKQFSKSSKNWTNDVSIPDLSQENIKLQKFLRTHLITAMMTEQLENAETATQAKFCFYFPPRATDHSDPTPSRQMGFALQVT